jgi:hypothetical protein
VIERCEVEYSVLMEGCVVRTSRGSRRRCSAVRSSVDAPRAAAAAHRLLLGDHSQVEIAEG